jgi:hypothetical protein
MLRNNVRLRGFVNYVGAPVFNETDKKWYVWYYETEDFKGMEKVLAEKSE